MSKKKLIKQIINQANYLNKKIKEFKDNNIVDHIQFVQAFFNDEQMQYSDTDRLTKSTKFYEDQNELQLERTLTVLKKISTHEIYGTVKKYNKNYTDAWQTLMDTVTKSLEKKGYDSSYINQIINSKDFVNSLCIALKDIPEGMVSDGVIEKVFLEHARGVINDEYIERTISDLEHMTRRVAEADAEEDEYQRWKEEQKQAKRRNGGR